MKKAKLKELLKKRREVKEVKIIGAERPVITPYNGETRITIDEDGNIKEIEPKTKKEKKAK